MSQSFYDFKAVNLKGEEVSFSKYKGKVVLIENVASLWGTTVRDYTEVKYNGALSQKVSKFKQWEIRPLPPPQKKTWVDEWNIKITTSDINGRF